MNIEHFYLVSVSNYNVFINLKYDQKGCPLKWKICLQTSAICPALWLGARGENVPKGSGAAAEEAEEVSLGPASGKVSDSGRTLLWPPWSNYWKLGMSNRQTVYLGWTHLAAGTHSTTLVCWYSCRPFSPQNSAQLNFMHSVRRRRRLS